MNLISYEKILIKTFDIFSKRLWQEPIMVGPTVSIFHILDLCMSLTFPGKFYLVKTSLYVLTVSCKKIYTTRSYRLQLDLEARDVTLRVCRVKIQCFTH